MNETIDTTQTISAADRKIIQRATRLLCMIMQPSLFARARHEGYSPAEHRLGWRLVATAGGSNLSLDELQAEVLVAQTDTSSQEKRMARLQQIDEIENTWLPRARTILRRAVPPARRDAFEAVFFEGIEQQPLGPAVIGSVEAFVGRVMALDASPSPDAKSFRKMLSARGLTTERIAEVSALLAKAKEVETASGPSPEVVDGLKASRADRAKAMQELRDWYADWSTTLRTTFNGREQIKLGLTAKPSGKKKAKAKSPDEGPTGPVD